MKKFNGWQRLLVVGSVLALPLTVTVWHHEFRDSFPTEGSVRAGAQKAAAEAVRIAVDERAFLRCLARDLPADGTPFADLSASMTACREELGGKPTPEMERRSEKALADGEAYIRNGLRTDQAKALLTPLGAWIALCLSVYLAGAAVAWVIRGFRTPKAEA